jgi:hypothetical protein
LGLKYLNSLIRIWDPGSGIRDPRWKKFGSRIWDLGWKKFRSGIWDPEETSQSSKTGNLLAKFARTFKNQIMIKPFVEMAFWDETKSFLQSKAASVVFSTDPDRG